MTLVLVVMEAELLHKRQGLRCQRREQFTMTAGAAVPSSRDAISETSHNHFFVLFYMPRYSFTLDVFVSSNVFHIDAVLSVC